MIIFASCGTTTKGSCNCPKHNWLLKKVEKTNYINASNNTSKGCNDFRPVPSEI